jgi:protein SCO1/2
MTPLIRVIALLAGVMFAANAARASQSWHGDYFPNIVLTDQDGKTHRFYDDIIKGKVVALNFIYTRCKDVCPADTAQLTRVQDLLGAQVGRDVFMYSISLEPEHDTPAVLKDYMHMFNVKPGWMFLTGKKDEIETLQRKLGLIGSGITPELREHDTSFIVGNETTGQWIKRSPYDDPKVLAILLGETLNNGAGGSMGRASYAAAPQVTGRSAGEYLFRTRCTSCHTIGKGDRLGPDLQGVPERRSTAWLVRWLKEPDKMIEEKDPAVVDMLSRYRGLPMPNLGLTDADASAMIEYLQNPDSGSGITPQPHAPHSAGD